MGKLLPAFAATLLVTAACAGDAAETPATDAATTGAANRQPAPTMSPSAAVVAETASVTVDPSIATDPPPAAYSTAPAAGSTPPPAPRP